MLNIIIRTDSSVDMGCGHLMRCLNLAKELRRSDNHILFVCRDLPGNRNDLIKDAGFSIATLAYDRGALDNRLSLNLHQRWIGELWHKDASQTIEAVQKESSEWDWLIVDSYGLDRNWEKALRPHVKKIMVIDDLADRHHDCNLLLDQNYHPNSRKRYVGLIPPDCELLLGPEYSLLRSEFRKQIKNGLKERNSVNRIFLLFGGSDPKNVTKLVLNSISQSELTDIKVDVVVGKSNPHQGEIEDLCSDDDRFNFFCQPDNIAVIMARADLAIGSGGMNTWERCCLGLPTIIITFADNQVEIAKSLHDAGAALYLGKSDDLVVNTIKNALNRIANHQSPDIREISHRAAQLVDGYGCLRVCKNMGCFKYTINLVSDETSWMNQYLPSLLDMLEKYGHNVNWVHQSSRIQKGHLAFFLSFFLIVDDETLAKNEHNLVVHESKLPEGKGWSPLSWQILEGKSEIPIVLFEALAEVDSGKIYLKEMMEFEGTELVAELRSIQAQKTIQMCLQFVDNYPDILKQGVPQQGESTYYPRRRPVDSRLDPDKTIREQFNLLRTVDNDKYPAYFELGGLKYIVKIYKN